MHRRVNIVKVRDKASLPQFSLELGRIDSNRLGHVVPLTYQVSEASNGTMLAHCHDRFVERSEWFLP